MLLCIDIGNSSISLGLYERTADSPSDRPKPTMTAKLSSDTGRTADEYAILLQSLLGDRASAVTAAVMGSVVPQLTHTMESAVRRIFGGDALTVLHIGGGVRTGISLRVDDPAVLGADIVVNAAAAVHLYGAPVIFMDYGTATVMGAVNAARELCGVAIAPGLYTSLEGLRASAAQIPYMELSSPKSTLGKNTPAAIRAGLIAGTACMTDGMIDRVRRELKLAENDPCAVVATGGLAELVLPECVHDIHHEPELTLFGLYCVYEATQAREQRHKR